MLLYGATRLAQVITYNLFTQESSLYKIIDDKSEKKAFMELYVKHIYDASLLPQHKMILALGDHRVRQAKSEVIKHQFSNVVYLPSQVFESDVIEIRVVIFQYIVIQIETLREKHVILNTGVILEQGAKPEGFVHLESVVIGCGQIFAVEGTLIDTGATSIPDIYTRKWCMIETIVIITKEYPRLFSDCRCTCQGYYIYGLTPIFKH